MLKYAFVGSEWKGCEYPRCQPGTCKAVCGGGNSGLSLRRKSYMLNVATSGNLPEDLWGAWVPRKQVADRSAYFFSDELHNNSDDRWFEDDLQMSYKLSRLGLLPPHHILARFAVSTFPWEFVHCLLVCTNLGQPLDSTTRSHSLPTKPFTTYANFLSMDCATDDNTYLECVVLLDSGFD